MGYRRPGALRGTRDFRCRGDFAFTCETGFEQDCAGGGFAHRDAGCSRDPLAIENPPLELFGVNKARAIPPELIRSRCSATGAMGAVAARHPG
jgi:hypothetical protein